MAEALNHVEEKYHIPLFTGKNYDNWRFRLETLLDERNLLELVQQEVQFQPEVDNEKPEAKEARDKANEKLKQRDKHCKRLIISSISDSHLEYCKGKDSAYELWKALEGTFQRKGIASQLQVRKSLLSMKHNPNAEGLEAHFLKFDSNIRDLRSAGAKLDEIDIICHLLLTMPGEYNMVVTALETMPSEQLTLSFVKGRLLDEEMKRGSSRKVKPSVDSVFIAHNKYTHSKSNQGKTSKPKQFSDFKCHNCGGQGHFRKNCPSPKTTFQKSIHKAEIATVHSKNEVNSSHDIAFLTSSAESCFDSPEGEFVWWLDSGASEHMVPTSEQVHDIHQISPVTIQVAKSGVSLIAKERGTMTLYNTDRESIVISDVLIVPGLHMNLLSVQKLERNGLTIVFKNGKATVLKGNYVVATAHHTNKLYKLVLCTSCETASLSSECEELWHKRFGHIGKTSIQKLSTMVHGLKEETSKTVCEPCAEGKSTKLPHNVSRKRATRPLELIHTDIFGPVTPTSYDDKRYVLVFTDDYTHFTAAYPMERKSDTFQHLKIYEAMVSAHFQRKISRLRCDRGGEYVSTAFKSYCQEKGIQIEYTIAYTPEQNGVAERMNRSIVEKARCMLLSSSLPKTLWSEAVKTAVYLLNRSPTSALKDSVPATLWYGQKPSVEKLKIFGSTAYLHTPKQLSKGKFDSRTRKLFLVGYCTNGYRLWCPFNEQIVEGRDVLFDEKSSYKSETLVNININEISENPIDHLPEQSESSEDVLHVENDETEDNVNNGTSDVSSKELMRENRNRKPPAYLQEYELDYDSQNDSESNLALLNTLEKEVISCEYALNIVSNISVPDTIDDLKGREDRDKWMKAIDEELSALEENNTWTVTELPPGKKALNSKWVFRVKSDAYGNVEKYKARLVIKGCSQKAGVDYSETYAPVASLVTVRTLLSVINHNGLFAEQLDVKNAFLHGTVKEEIYMKLPDGLDDDHTKNPLVCKLNKTLYGLKQAPMEWNAKFDCFVQANGFKQTLSDKCLYINSICGTILLLYVDDIIITGTSKEILMKWKEVLMSEFKMTDLGPLHLFLGIKIDRTNEGMFLTQSQYIQNLLNRFGMANCNSAATPIELDPTQELQGDCILETKPYRELIGCLSYLSLTTRPDISVAVNFYSRFQSNATDAQWVGLKRILRYLKGTMEVGMFYKQSKLPIETLIGYADADFAGKTTNDKKSTSGYLFEVYGNNVMWATRKQTAVAQSSTEAEYVSLGTAVMSLIWLRRLVLELGGNITDPIKIYEDNQSAIHCLQKWEEKRLRHVDTKYNLVKDLYRKGIINVIYVPTNYQKADVLTKPLSGHKFKTLCSSLGLINCK